MQAMNVKLVCALMAAALALFGSIFLIIEAAEAFQALAR